MSRSFRNKSVDVHKFAMIPKQEIPRSSFRIQTMRKTTFDAGLLIPFYVDEVLPGDTFNLRATLLARMSQPLWPLMDNVHIDTHFFFIPNRLVWSNWVKFCGEQINPGDSTAFTIPIINATNGGYAVGSIYDHMGLPVVGQVTAGLSYTHSALPLRAYNLVYNQWFRDENLQSQQTVSLNDGPDLAGTYGLQYRGKRPDYFTTCLPFVQKGSAPTVPLGTSAPVVTTGVTPNFSLGGVNRQLTYTSGSTTATWATAPTNSGQPAFANPTGLQADLSAAVGATINQMRQAFQIQRLLERDARGGTRYVEILQQHFGVFSGDARLQRPEYLGGGTTPVNFEIVPQTSGSGASGTTSPLGTLTANATAVAHRHGFSASFVEHGIILGLVSARADLNYQQGVRRMWSRSTRYDFYWPAFAHLGEQAVTNKEIYCKGDANDALVFGYQERWAEYRYNPSLICGLFRSGVAGTLDAWHLAQNFSALPTLNDTFIRESPPLSRVLAAGAAANGQQFLLDAFFDIVVARPLPLFSVPGQIDRF